MKNNFIDAIEKEAAWKVTENGLEALNTTFDACLDLFSTIGALRTRSDAEIEKKFEAAYCESPLTAMKTVFYARDIKEGLGERRVAKVCLKHLASRHPEDIKANFGNIVKYGRFDDLYCLTDTAVEKEAYAYMKAVFAEDIKAYNEHKPYSLAAKWLKSANGTDLETRRLGRLTAKYFGLSEATYRRALSKLRRGLDLIETQMTENKWDVIDFTKVPGGAVKKYTKAFCRHQKQRYFDYIIAVKEGKKISVKAVDGTEKEVIAKINTKYLFPYEILEKYISKHSWGNIFCLKDKRKYRADLEVMWAGLNDYIQGVESNTIVIADTSLSMAGRPMATSVGLGIYFAERNRGVFHNKFMTFSSKPSWVSLPEGASLYDKLSVVPSICETTNLEAAFDLILNTAVSNGLSQEDMPKSLIIITDMEFDQCVVDNSTRCKEYPSHTTDMTFYDRMKANYEVYGYKLPNITFWNASARNNTYHVTKNIPHVRLVSGQSPSVFRSLIDGKAHTPYEVMLEVLSSSRYDSVVLGK